MIGIAICIATCQRPSSLHRLLESLSYLRFDKRPYVDLCVIVVDNEATGTAKPIAEHWAEKLRWPLVYGIEPRRGIAMTRNKLVALAKDVDFIAFIDDDEVSHTNWLDELLSVQRRYHADVVTGPVVPCFEFNPPRWVIKGKFFERTRHTTGKIISSFRTGNVLIRRSLFSKVEGPFNERLALVGGEDMYLSLRLSQVGARIVWADEAVVEEIVSESRATSSWLIQRAFRGGNSYTLCQRYLSSSKSRIFIRAITAAGRIVQGFLMIVPSLFWGQAATVRSMQLMSMGAGSIMGLFGKVYEEYRNIHGS